MRQVFSSPRLENVERVAELLRAEAIEVRIVNGRSYKGSRRSTFSYREGASGPRPSVWVVRAEDQTRARALLREAGLLQNLPSTRSYLGQGEVVFATERPAPRQGMSRASKVRYTLLGGAALVTALAWLSRPDADAPTADESAVFADAPAAEARRLDMVPPTVEATVNRLPVPQALAETLLAAELAGLDGTACVAVDGRAPSAPLLAALASTAPDVRSLAACDDADAAPRLDIANYRTDGSGRGTVDVIIDVDAARTSRTLDVVRDGRTWSVAPPE